MNSLAVLLPGFEGTELPEWLAERLRAGLAGVCLFATNVASRDQLRALTAAIREANPIAIIAIDEEGGDVTRLAQSVGSPYPGNAILGRLDDLAYTEEIARAVGHQLRDVGVTLDLAPDVDINSNDANPVIGVRSFGSSAELVARHSAAWVRGLQSTGVAASAKHFPGHGDTAADSHLALPVVDLPLETLRERELLPFAAAIAADSATIMTSHILLPKVDAENPATFSRAILGDLLRGELDFSGVIVSDALDMKGASGEIGIPSAAVSALTAGCDLLCIGTNNTDAQLGEIATAVASGVDSDRLADAIERVRALASSYRSQDIPDGAYDKEPAFDAVRTATAFDIAPHIGVTGELHILQFITEANIAVGDAPWGALATDAVVTAVREGDSIVIEPGRQPVLIGRDNHRRAWVAAAIDEVRQQHPSTLVVDVGWPSADRHYADVATFGASRHVGEALMRWLTTTAPALRTATEQRTAQ
jgi:beta-N-acetylhexosaminidase